MGQILRSTERISSWECNQIPCLSNHTSSLSPHPSLHNSFTPGVKLICFILSDSDCLLPSQLRLWTQTWSKSSCAQSLFYAFVTGQCWQRHYVFRLSRCPVLPVRYCYHDISWTPRTILIKLTGKFISPYWQPD